MPNEGFPDLISGSTACESNAPSSGLRPPSPPVGEKEMLLTTRRVVGTVPRLSESLALPELLSLHKATSIFPHSIDARAFTTKNPFHVQ